MLLSHWVIEGSHSKTMRLVLKSKERNKEILALMKLKIVFEFWIKRQSGKHARESETFVRDHVTPNFFRIRWNRFYFCWQTKKDKFSWFLLVLTVTPILLSCGTPTRNIICMRNKAWVSRIKNWGTINKFAYIRWHSSQEIFQRKKTTPEVVMVVLHAMWV